jgi:hypothetical protein
MDGALEELRADFVVDAGGRGSGLVKKLSEGGASIEDEYHPSQTAYCRGFSGRRL